MVQMGDCVYLEWDSRFFGLHIGRYLPKELSEVEALAANVWCAENDIDCLYYLAGSNDPVSVTVAENAGFRFVDMRVTLAAKLVLGQQSHLASPDGFVLRSASLEDVPELQKMAAEIYTHGRFHSDTRFGPAKARALYTQWIRNSCDCDGFADYVFVADSEGVPLGYITCKLGECGTGNIGLIGVDSSAQGRGVGRTLVFAAMDWFSSKGVTQVEVVTQGSNISAQRLYQVCGFTTNRVELWYHLWPQQRFVR